MAQQRRVPDAIASGLIAVRVTPDERDLIEFIAKELGLTLTQYVRGLVLEDSQKELRIMSKRQQRPADRAPERTRIKT
jgi:hypothetical protein